MSFVENIRLIKINNKRFHQVFFSILFLNLISISSIISSDRNRKIFNLYQETNSESTKPRQKKSNNISFPIFFIQTGSFLSRISGTKVRPRYIRSIGSPVHVYKSRAISNGSAFVFFQGTRSYRCWIYSLSFKPFQKTRLGSPGRIPEEIDTFLCSTKRLFAVLLKVYLIYIYIYIRYIYIYRERPPSSDSCRINSFLHRSWPLRIRLLV